MCFWEYYSFLLNYFAGCGGLKVIQTFYSQEGMDKRSFLSFKDDKFR